MTAFPSHLRIGTRGSDLARWQADRVASLLREQGVDAEIILIKTLGDLDQRTKFSELGGKGIFIKEIEQALLEGSIDLAVHSLKDVPTQLAPGLALACVPERVSPLDAWVSHTGAKLDELPAGARVATGSLRREAQLRALRPDLVYQPLRGNVPTRLGKVKAGEADATLLAEAGMRRLGLETSIVEVMDADRMTPPMGQGALGIETREGEAAGLWQQLEDPTARRAVEIERRFLARIGGGCSTPAGVLAEPAQGGGWRVVAMIASPDGRQLIRRRDECSSNVDPVDWIEDWTNGLLADAPETVKATLRLPPGGHAAP